MEQLSCGRLVALASITQSGYPRPVVMSVIKVEEEMKAIWFATAVHSEKVVCYQRNSRAGISLFNDHFSASILGDVSVVTDMKQRHALWNIAMLPYFPLGEDDPNYSLLRFTPVLLKVTSRKEKGNYESETMMM